MGLKKRFFSTTQRATLFIRAQGMCEMCGKRLQAGWHADHKRAYSKGGPTDTLNGQALCPECDLDKGDKEDE